MEFIQEKDRIVILYTQNNQVRHVRLNFSHPRNLKPTPTGDSIAHYEGDTLVIDTVGFNDKSWWDNRGYPHTERLHIIERWTRIDEGHLNLQVTIDDPGAYTKPWDVKFQARLTGLRGDELLEYICQENNQYGIAQGH
jgi:hypothetical protein